MSRRQTTDTVPVWPGRARREVRSPGAVRGLSRVLSAQRGKERSRELNPATLMKRP